MTGDKGQTTIVNSDIGVIKCLLFVGLITSSWSLLVPQPVSALEIFVSTSGNDQWSGTLAEPNQEQSDGPVATLTKARDLVRGHLRRSGASLTEPTYITLRGGVYRLTEAVQLGSADSGSSQAPVIYRAYQDEKPILSGAVEVSDFQPDTSSPNIYRAALPEAISDPAQVRLILYRGARLPMARWPNRDAQNPIAGGWAYVSGRRTAKASESIWGETEENRQKLSMNKPDIRRWQTPTDGELFIFTRFNYWNDLVPIESYDAKSGIIRTKSACSYAIRPGDRYFVQGMREELDTAGEWYIDRAARSLLIYSNGNQDKLKLELAVAGNLIRTHSGASHIRFENLTFQACNETAIKIIQSNHIEVVDCTLEHLGDLDGDAIAFHDGTANRAKGCEINDIGAHGVFISGGDEKTLQGAGHVAESNHIHHTGVINKHTAGVWLMGVGNSAIKNVIHDLPRTGVMMPFKGANARNIVEYNHIHHTNLETQDTGAIYASGRHYLPGRGHAIRYNFVHDTPGFGWDGQRWATPFYAWGIYLDDACSSTEVIGNVVARSSRGSLMVHSGQDNRIENNIFIDGGLQQIELRGWEPSFRHWKSLMPEMERRYAEVKDQPAWQAFKLVPPSQADRGTGKVMIGNVFQRNIIVYSGRDPLYMDILNLGEPFTCNRNLIYSRGTPPKIQIDNRSINLEQWKAQGHDTQSRQGDPKFKDASKDDYRLDENSPAFNLGFEPIPFDKIAP